MLRSAEKAHPQKEVIQFVNAQFLHAPYELQALVLELLVRPGYPWVVMPFQTVAKAGLLLADALLHCQRCKQQLYLLSNASCCLSGCRDCYKIFCPAGDSTMLGGVICEGSIL